MSFFFFFAELRAWKGDISADALNLGPQLRANRGKQRKERSHVAGAGEVGVREDFTEVGL